MTNKGIKNNDGSAYEQRSLFGRRQGRALKGERAKALSNILPLIEINTSLLKENHKTDPSEFFDKKFNNYQLEIGFGHGERLLELFQSNPDIAYIGAEPFINGMANLLKNIPTSQPTKNIRVLMDDGMIIAKSITPNSLDKIFILNPDPWHKKRHHKRRIINQTNLDIFATILKPKGQLIMTSDVPDLAQWMCIQASNHKAFEWEANSKDSWQIPPKDWIATKYEKKGAKGSKTMSYLFFNKNCN